MAIKQRKKPQRTCIACRQVRDKRDLVRVVRSPDGSVQVDHTGKAQGRGAYICNKPECWRKALSSRGSLAAALKTELDAPSRVALEQYATGLEAIISSGKPVKE